LEFSPSFYLESIVRFVQVRLCIVLENPSITDTVSSLRTFSYLVNVGSIFDR
jgi:hypothetical protein